MTAPHAMVAGAAVIKEIDENFMFGEVAGIKDGFWFEIQRPASNAVREQMGIIEDMSEGKTHPRGYNLSKAVGTV